MRHFVIDLQPTAEQLSAIEAEMMETATLMPALGDRFLISFDDEQYPTPSWLVGEEEVRLIDDAYAHEALGFNPRKVVQSTRPTPAIGELLLWVNPDDDSACMVYNDAELGIKTWREGENGS